MGNKVGTLTAGAAIVVGIIVTGLFSSTIVDARAVGVQTGFGRYISTLDNGFHLKYPWASVEEFSTRVQYLNVEDSPVTYKAIAIPEADASENTGAEPQGTLYGGDGSVDLVVRWTIQAKDAKELWERYKSFENVRDQLVFPTTKDSLRLVVSEYTPAEAKDGGNIRAISDAAVADLNKTLNSNGVGIDSVSISNVLLGQQAQKAVDRVVAADADIDRAAREQQRAAIDAQTAKLRTEEGALTPEALQRYCLDLVNAWDVAKNGQLPATFNCTLNGTNSTPVIVNTK